MYMYINPCGSQSKLYWTALMRANKPSTVCLFALVHLIFSCRLYMYIHVYSGFLIMCLCTLTTHITGDTFSTPPNSPSVRRSTSSSSGPGSQKDKDSMTSYEKAVDLNPTGVWKDESKINHTMPHHVSSPPLKQQPPLSSPPANLLPGYPNVEIVNSSPAAVRVGFFDATVEATNPGELPGSSQGREDVITTPPHASNSSVNKKPVSLTGLARLFGSSHDSTPRLVRPTHDTRETRSTSPRGRSIEEVDRGREKMYVPQDRASQRKGSTTTSQFSLLSVSLVVHVLQRAQ